MNATASTPSAKLYSLGGITDSLVADAAMRREAHAACRPIGPVTGFSSLDKILAGCLAPGVHIVHAGPGAGKTAFCLGIACTCRVPALFVSGEISPVEVMRRLIARQTKTFLGKLKTGELSPDTVRELADSTAAAYPMFGLLDCTTAPCNMGDIATALTSIKTRAKKVEIPGALLVVDSLHTLAGKIYPGMDEYQRLGLALADFETFAQTVGIPVLLISERSRATMKETGQHSGAGSRRLEYSCESMLALDVDEKSTTPDPQGLYWNTVKLNVSKNRHGENNKTIILQWNGALQTFRELPGAK